MNFYARLVVRTLIAIGAGTLAAGDIARATPCSVQFKNLYHASGNPKNPIQFSYEIEFSLKENPALVDYYRPQSFTDQDWFNLSRDERLKLATDHIEALIARGRTELMVKTSNAPDYLAPTMIDGKGGRVELSSNEVNASLNQVEQHLKWIWKEIGPGSIQGHASLKRDRPSLGNPTAFATYAKHESEIAYLDSLDRNYSRFEQTGKLGASVIENPSLGPIDRRTFESIQKRVQQDSIFKNDPNSEDKLIYGVTFRPDLYGFRRTGFEVRNCHKSIDCVTKSMHDVATELESGFSRYSSIVDDVLVDATTKTKWSPDVTTMLDEISKLHDSRTNLRTGGAPTDLRFTLPLTNWEDHPLVKALAPEVRDQTQARILAARERYVTEMNSIATSGGTVEEKSQRAVVAMSRWSSEAKLGTALRNGRSIVTGRTDELSVAEKFSASTSKYTEKQIAGLRRALPSRVNSEGKKNPPVKTETLQMLSEAGIGYEDAKKLIKSRGLQELLSEPSATRHTIRFLEEAIGIPAKKCATTWECIETARYISRLSEESAKMIATSLMRQGFPDSRYGGGLTKRVLRKSNPEALHGVASAANRLGTSETFFEIVNSPFLHVIPDEFKLGANAEALVKIFTQASDQTAQRAQNEAKTFLLKSVYLGRKISIPNSATARSYESIISKMATDVKALNSNTALVTIDGKLYRLARDRTMSNLELSAVDESQRLNLEKQSQAYLTSFTASGPRKLPEIATRFLVESNPDSVFVVSSPLNGINHQGLVIGDRVYDVGGPALKSNPFSTWLESWYDRATLVRIRPTGEQMEALAKYIDQHSGTTGVPNPRDTKPNCASAIACALEDANIIQLPDRYTQRDAIGQLGFLRSQIGRNPQVVSVSEITQALPPRWTPSHSEIARTAALYGTGYTGLMIGTYHGINPVMEQVNAFQEFDVKSNATTWYVRDTLGKEFPGEAFIDACSNYCSRATCADFRYGYAKLDELSCLLPDASTKQSNREAISKIRSRLTLPPALAPKPTPNPRPSPTPATRRPRLWG